jgi:hypothetical protein
MIGYKLFRKRKDGSYGPLFINRRQKLHAGRTYHAEDHKTKGFAHRPGWHVCSAPVAPHLSKKDRVWCKVDFDHKETLQRPECQGGTWYLGHSLQIIEELR